MTEEPMRPTDLSFAFLSAAVVTGVVAVMVGVDQHLDALGSTLLQARHADFRGRHELAVNHDRALGTHQVANRSAVAGEIPDAAPDLLELRHRRLRSARLCRRLRRERPAQSKAGDGED